MSEFVNNAIFWVEVEKIKPNPYQPRKEFDQAHLRDLADSIRQYGILQPLVVTRSETELPEGGMTVEYELIAGERRLRASKIAGVARVPVIIQQGVTDPRLKLELAIIENLQREDLNPVDRAISFGRLAQEFNLKHVEIAKKVGKSREYVSNTLRLLVLPQDILDSLALGRITEGHARPLMMLSDRKDEQSTLFKEIIFKKLTVREAEQIARHIAFDKIRKKMPVDPEMEKLEKELAESLGTRVSIERRQVGGGKVVIDFFSSDDLRAILEKVHMSDQLSQFRALHSSLEVSRGSEIDVLSRSTPIEMPQQIPPPIIVTPLRDSLTIEDVHTEILPQQSIISDDMSTTVDGIELHIPTKPSQIHTSQQTNSAKKEEDENLYSVSGFTI